MNQNDKIYGFALRIVSLNILVLFLSFGSFGQDASQPNEKSYYSPLYPWSSSFDAGFSTPHYKPKDGDEETIFLDGRLDLKIPVYNNVYEISDDKKDWFHAASLDFAPYVRIYNTNSKPVKTPSFKAHLNYQLLYRSPLKTKSNDQAHFFGLTFQHGHYSNGQDKCTWSSDIDDGTTECAELYDAINENTNLSEILNRDNGNFSTNLTCFTFGWMRIQNFKDSDAPKSITSVQAGITAYHKTLFLVTDEGGYSDRDIGIYGKNRFHIEAHQRFHFVKNEGGDGCRLWTQMKYTYIQNPHAHVAPSRLRLRATIFPGFWKVGVTAGVNVGHDEYNYRFVDSGTSFFVGLSFDPFPSIPVRLR